MGHPFPELGSIWLYNDTNFVTRLAEMTAVQLAFGSFDDKPSIGRAAYF
jgi:hypothetical protein